MAKHDYENILKKLKDDKENNKKKYKSSNKKNVWLIITEILIGSGSEFGSSSMALINPSAGICIMEKTSSVVLNEQTLFKLVKMVFTIVDIQLITNT